MMWVRCILGVCTFVAAGLNTSCGSPGCNGEKAESVSGSPTVKNFYLLGDRVPGDPWTQVFAVAFSDSDGDLASGQAEFFLNSDEQPNVQELDGVFRQSGVAAAASSGTLWLALRFGDTLPDGASVRLSLQLVDAKKHRSNCFSLELDFDVRSAQAPVDRQIVARQVACGAHT